MGLVKDKVRQLPKGPATHHPVEPLAAAYPVTNPIEALQRQRWVGILSRKLHQLATDLVVEVGHPAPLLAPHSPHPVGTAVSLQPFAKGNVAFPAMTDGLAIDHKHAPRMPGCSQPNDT
ncbi:hypothetical protein FCL43_023010, partial [Enterobacter hormaechei]|nr:hypothetical protein [Enterobacter hormaechei]